MIFNTSFHKGTTRYVLVIPFLNIAIKFPKINPPHKVLKNIVYVYETGAEHNTGHLINRILWGSVDRHFSVKWQLFRGIVANWKEYRFYRDSRNPLLWPTKFSLFGIMNIQPLVECHPTESADPFPFVCKITGNKAWVECHTFGELRNFTVDRGNHLRIIDYASPRSQAVIAEFGEQIYTQSRSLFERK